MSTTERIYSVITAATVGLLLALTLVHWWAS